MGKIVRINPGSGFNSPQYGLSSRPKSPAQNNFSANVTSERDIRHPCLPWFGCGLTRDQKTQLLDHFVRSIKSH